MIFVGYPIRWYTLPVALFGFFDEYDFTGKTIIPFDTHFTSGRGGGRGFSILRRSAIGPAVGSDCGDNEGNTCELDSVDGTG